MKAFWIGAVALAVFSTAAMANECPSLINKAQEELKAMAGMDAAMLKEAEAYIQKAQAEHDAGKHDESVADAKKALELLKM